MREEVTIVTAFFDIGRENWQGKMQRSNEKYFEYFDFWARIKNKVIMYTEPQYREKVLAIREKYGLAGKTEVIPIENKAELDREVYEAMEKALKNPIAQSFRVERNHPEVYNPDYNYIMYLKYYFLSKAAKDGITGNMCAWMDFGYNKGGHFYTNVDDFDFLWTTDLTSDKIHLFTFGAEEELWEFPIFEVVRTLEVYISGEMIIAPKTLAEDFRALCRRAELSLGDTGLSDDDQTILLMAYRTRPELFELHQMLGWCDQMKFATDKKFATRKGANVPHKEAKRLAKKDWREKKYKSAAKHYADYVSLKLKGK